MQIGELFAFPRVYCYMVTQSPSERAKLMALRGAYRDAFQRFRLQVRQRESLLSDPASDRDAIEEARLQVEQAQLAYRKIRDELALFALSSDRRHVATAGGQAQTETLEIDTDSQSREAAADRRSQVERLAHQLWEQAGQPSGQAEEHWYLAERLIHSAQ